MVGLVVCYVEICIDDDSGGEKRRAEGDDTSRQQSSWRMRE